MTREAKLWLILLAGPVVWMLSFGTVFTLSGWVCFWQSKLAMYAVSTVGLVATALAVFMAFGEWRALGRGSPGEAGGEIAAARVMAMGAIILNASFFIVLFAQMIPEFLLMGCE